MWWDGQRFTVLETDNHQIQVREMAPGLPACNPDGISTIERALSNILNQYKKDVLDDNHD